MSINKKLSENQKFSTFDLSLASALIALDYKLSGLDKNDRKKVCFIFEKNDDIEKAIKNYWDNSLRVNAQTLFNSQKMLKNRIYSE